MKLHRRGFLAKVVAAGAGIALLNRGGTAADPFARKAAPRFGLSCAAYSLRKYLALKDPRMTLEDFIVKCAEWGTDGVELTEYYFKKPITPAYVMGLKRLALLWGQDITGTPIGNNFALPPGEARDQQVSSVKKWIEISADLGSPAIRIFAGTTPKGVDEAQARKWVVECIESCCDLASKRGVFLAVENHGGVVAKAEGLLEIIRAVQCDWVAINLDTGNFHGPDPYQEIAQCAPYSITCQLKTELTPAGGKRQDVDMARLVEILRKAGYRGYVTLEYEGAEEPLEAVPKHLAKMRTVLG